ncbi:MAG: DUF86 domain-containing protein [Candidatus Kuenenbacteria bacterium]
MKDDLIYLSHILEAVDKIEKYLKNVDYEFFLKSTIVIDAVTRNFEIIGEAANNISDEFKEKHPEFSWFDMSNMRNKLIHEYFGVDLNIVWDTCKNDLPKLKEQLQKIEGV